MRHLSIDDLRRQARRNWPAVVRDYVDGGADAEVSLRANLDAFTRYRFQPRILRPSGTGISTAVSLLGRPAALPMALAPTGYSRLMHPAGEFAVARAAHRTGIPYTASTMATTSIQALGAAAAPDADLWFQLYAWVDPGLTRDLIGQARDTGCRVLVLTVDAAVTGNRLRDARNQFTPPQVPRSTVLRALPRHPGWAIARLRGGALSVANLAAASQAAAAAQPAQAGTRFQARSPIQTGSPVQAVEPPSERAFAPTLSWDDVAAIRADWPGRLLLKGPLGPDDVQTAVAAGVDGVVLSNHGGRQLDQSQAPIDTLAAVRDQVGDEPTVLVDSGVRRGSDIAIALALGADAVLIGRPYLYGLGAAGEPGVDAALRILASELVRTMALLGVADVGELRKHGRDLVRRPS